MGGCLSCAYDSTSDDQPLCEASRNFTKLQETFYVVWQVFQHVVAAYDFSFVLKVRYLFLGRRVMV